MALVKNPPANAGNVRDACSIPGSERSPGIGHGNPLQYSCVENPIDRGAWWATVHGVTKSQTQLSDISSNKAKLIRRVVFHIFTYFFNLWLEG